MMKKFFVIITALFTNILAFQVSALSQDSQKAIDNFISKAQQKIQDKWDNFKETLILSLNKILAQNANNKDIRNWLSQIISALDKKQTSQIENKISDKSISKSDNNKQENTGEENIQLINYLEITWNTIPTIIPKNSDKTRILKIQLTAHDRQAQVEAITIKLNWFVSKDQIKSVLIEDEYYKTLTNVRAFNSEYEARLIFQDPLVIVKNTTKTLFVDIWIQNIVSEVFWLSIPDKDHLESDLPVDWNFPIK